MKEQLANNKTLEKTITKLETQIQDGIKQVKSLKEKISGLQKNIDDEKFKGLKTKKMALEKQYKEFQTLERERIEFHANAKRNLVDHQKEMKNQQDIRDKIKQEQSSIANQKKNHDRFLELEKIFKRIGERILSRLRNQINLVTSDILGQLGNPQLRGNTK